MPRTYFHSLRAKGALHAVQVVWFGLPCVLVLCHSSVVQMLPLEECSGLVALQLLPAQPVGHLPPELSKCLQHELSNHLQHELSEHLQNELSKYLQDELTKHLHNELSEHLHNELSEHLQNELSKHLQNEFSKHLQIELSKHLHDEQFELVRTHLVRWSASAG